MEAFEGRGIWYWASPIEARMCRREEIVLVGGGNSAGQAAVFLSGFADKVWMLVRGPGLAETMSRYLIDRIAAAPNIELLAHTEVVALSGTPEGQLSHVRWRNSRTGEEQDKPIRNLFLFIGADPATAWLAGCGVAMDARGFRADGGGRRSGELPAACWRKSPAAVGIERARCVRGGRCALRLGQTGRRRHRRGRRGRGATAFAARRSGRSAGLKGDAAS